MLLCVGLILKAADESLLEKSHLFCKAPDRQTSSGSSEKIQVASASTGDIYTVTAPVGQSSELSLSLELPKEGPGLYMALYSDP